MKIITLNTHSLVEKGYEKKLRQFADMVLAEQPDVFALQEVNQSVQAGCLAEEKLPGFVACPGIGRGLREDNHAARLAQILFAAAAPYYWTWVPAKLGYGAISVFLLRVRRLNQGYQITEHHEHQPFPFLEL